MQTARQDVNAAAEPWIDRVLGLVLACATSISLLAGVGRAGAEPVPAARETSEIAPVWQLDVTQDSVGLVPRVVINAFVARKRRAAFPLRELPLRRVVMGTSGANRDRESLCFSSEIARLQVGPDGGIRSDSLKLVPANRVAVDPRTGRIAVLRLVDPEALSAGSASSDSTLDFGVDEGAVAGDLYRWEESPDRTWCLVHTSEGTSVFARGSLSPKAHLDNRIYYGEFSSDGSRYAAVAEEGAPRNPGELQWWILLGRDGRILRQGNPRREWIAHLHLSPDGRSLTFEQQIRHGVGVDLDSGHETPLPVRWDGHHYYSADGRTALDLESSSAGVQLFDLAAPLRPVAIGKPFEVDSAVVTAAVSGDGRLVAFQEVEPDDPHRVLMRVVVFDRRLRQRAIVLRNTRRGGLQFEGRYLFVGIQRDPVPACFEIQSTTGILVYDLSRL